MSQQALAALAEEDPEAAANALLRLAGCDRDGRSRDEVPSAQKRFERTRLFRTPMAGRSRRHAS